MENKAGAVSAKANMDSRLPKRRVVFAWDMHYSCNYRCPYCFYNVSGWAELAKKNVYKTPAEWAALWSRVYERHGRAQLRITAGEPFTYPRFVDVVEAVSRLHDIQVTSNCSQTETMDEFARRVIPMPRSSTAPSIPSRGILTPFSTTS